MMSQAKPKVSPFLTLIVLWLGYAPSGLPADDEQNCHIQSIEIIDLDLREGAGITPSQGSGEVKFCADEKGVSASVDLEGLENRHVYSAWWVFRTRPMTCVNPGFVDWSWSCNGALWEDNGDAGRPPVGRLNSGVANRSGKLHWHDKLRGFAPPPGSAMVILFRHHGEAQYSNPSRLARQRLTPETWVWGSPVAGNFYDYFTPPFVDPMAYVQFVIE